ncbi:RNA-binding protein 42 [Lepeophtheirus salmonis]|uniref:RNA-binding protein 42 n=1 Tax=Lepeophtheirus salmonis TaxID=72036 RepID=A0A0K2U9I0_LEPSM|nr:RNA-binding protein 42-like [Lepeophtheirus salmonis]
MMAFNFEEEMSRFEAEINRTSTISAAAKVNFVPPATRVTKKDEEDVFNTLLKYEKEIQQEKNHTSKPSKKSRSSGLMKPTAVTAQEISTKAKQVLEEKAKVVKPKILVKNPGPQASSSSSSLGTASHGNTSEESNKKNRKPKKIVRVGGGQLWEDESLKDWERNDYRIFCGDLGNDVTDEVLSRTFSRYSSFMKAKVIRDKRSNKTKGYGFVSFRDPQDFTRAMREMNGKYVGSRPIKMRKSNWKDRNLEIVKHKQKQKQAMGYKW